MDNVCNGVMKKISELTGVGKYVIISEDEFSLNPDDGQKNSADLKRALKSLQTAGYIDIKYSGGDLYCVAPLKKFAPEQAAEQPQAAEIIPAAAEGRSVKPFVLPFVASFFGSMAGSAVISLIFALV